MVAIALFWVIITGTSNAMNLIDGLDGLSTGVVDPVFAAYTLVNIWQNNQSCATAGGPTCYEVRDPLDLAVVAAAITGACFGFLWWNASPAAIFMGDTGSLALGGALAGLAILTRTELLLLIIGGLLVVVTLSVMIQVSVFKVSRASGLFRTVFRCQGGPPRLPDRAPAPPLRDDRLGAGHHRHPVLDHHRAVRRHRPGRVLRTVGRRRMTGPAELGRRDDWSGVRAVVAGFGVTGFAAADTLTHLGASVVALGEQETDDMAERAQLLGILGAEVATSAPRMPTGARRPRPCRPSPARRERRRWRRGG